MTELLLVRLQTNKVCTKGVLYIDGVFECFTLEDPEGPTDDGKGRIYADIYEMSYMPFVTPLTKKYRGKYPWFKHHIMLNTRFRNHIYIHIGNTHKDTQGCILLGDDYRYGRNEILSSYKAYKRFYKKIHPLLENEEVVTITILPEHNKFAKQLLTQLSQEKGSTPPNLVRGEWA